MNHLRLLRSLILFLAIAPVVHAAHPLLICDSNGNRVCALSADGSIVWEYPATHPQDCWRMPNGNYLFCYRDGAIEMSPTKQKIWEYNAPTNYEVHACQPLPNGRVMVVECGTSRIVEVDRAGRIAKEIKLKTLPNIRVHDQFRGTRKTQEGNYFVCFKGEHKVVQLDNAGEVLREIK